MNSHQTGTEQCTSGYINGTDPRIEMKMPSGSKSKATNREVSSSAKIFDVSLQCSVTEHYKGLV